jgi:ribosome-binding ATPase YchF (GTP1/OBG family)
VKKFGPKSEVQALLNVTDIAGLVKGASEGAGLGNAFLSHIMAIDGIFHMLRGFEGSEVTHVDGKKFISKSTHAFFSLSCVLNDGPLVVKALLTPSVT